MTDEIRPEGSPTATLPEPTTSAPEVELVVPTPEGDKPPKTRLNQEVEIKDIGPCKKSIRVTVSRADIDERMGEHYSKLVVEANVTGFRPGKAPRRLIEKRFQKDVANQVKGEILLASLEQLGKENDVAPLAAPDINPDNVFIPEKGPLVYEFAVEVRPQFDLPPYRGMKFKRPTHEVNEADVASMRRRTLRHSGQVVPKEDGSVEIGDIAIADVTFKDGETELSSAKEVALLVERMVAFNDGVIKNFVDALKGAKPGDKRTVDVQLSKQAAGGLGGKTVQAHIDIKEIKTYRYPELTNELMDQFGVGSTDMFDDMLREALVRQIEHYQRRSLRMQMLEQMLVTASWDLPLDLLRRQYHNARGRRMMEMKADGLSEQQIAAEMRHMEQDLLQETAISLKEHFILQKVAEAEKIEIDDDDLNAEIERMADEEGESPRKVRARLEKEELLESLAAQMIERKSFDLILDSAEYTNEPLPEDIFEQSEMATVDLQVVPGKMLDPTEEMEEPAPSEPA